MRAPMILLVRLRDGTVWHGCEQKTARVGTKLDGRLTTAVTNRLASDQCGSASVRVIDQWLAE